jgi:hypothetical protein
LHSDLIEQAQHLAKREPNRPRQASLRRAVSTAYYALFHMLISDAALKLVPNSPVWLRDQARRGRRQKCAYEPDSLRPLSLRLADLHVLMKLRRHTYQRFH